jgi:hypothetical protein
MPCLNGGVCVRTGTCDCAGSANFTGAYCESPPFSCGDLIVQAFNDEECDPPGYGYAIVDGC